MLRQGTFTKDKKVVLPPTGQVWVKTDNDGNIIEGGGDPNSVASEVEVTNTVTVKLAEDSEIIVHPHDFLGSGEMKGREVKVSDGWVKLYDAHPSRNRAVGQNRGPGNVIMLEFDPNDTAIFPTIDDADNLAFNVSPGLPMVPITNGELWVKATDQDSFIALTVSNVGV